MTLRRIASRGRLAPVTCALLCTAGTSLPAHAQLQGLTGSGLYDFLIQTNCFALSEQTNTRTPNWVFDGTYPDNRVPLLAPGTAKGIVRTVELADQVSFFSSNPAVIHAPNKIQAVGAIGGVRYQPTEVFFSIKTPSAPTNVDVTAEGSVTSVVGAVAQLGQPKRVTRKFRVYPPQKINRAALVPQKTTYQDGERLRIEVTLPWKIPISTAQVVIGQPVYKNANGIDVRAQLQEWRTGSAYAAKHLPVPPNSDKVSFEFVAQLPSDARMEQVGPTFRKASFKVPVELKVNAASCPELVTNPKTAEVRYEIQKRIDVNLEPKPTTMGPSQIQQSPLTLPGGSAGGVQAPRDPLPSKPDPEPDPDGQRSPRPGTVIRR